MRVPHVKIDLLLHPVVKELRATRSLQINDIDADRAESSAAVRHITDRKGDRLRLVVDHSYFTAKRTEFVIIEEEDDAKTSAEILQAVQDTVIELQQRTFERLASVNAAVINSLDENEIVHNVLREAMHVLPHCDAGVFRLFDEESGFLIPVSHAGLPDDYAHYRVQPNESVSGEVFATGLPAIHNGRQNIIAAHRVMSPESQSFMERSEIANALLCVPVVAEGKRLGTLTTLCFSSDGAFSAFDRTILESLAAQIAIAYQRSMAYTNAIATSHHLEQMRSDLARKNEDLDRAVALHEALLRIFSTGESLIGQLDAVADLFRVDFRFENVLGLQYRSSGWADRGEILKHAVEVAEAPVGQFYFQKSEDAVFHQVLFGTVATFVALGFVRDMSRMEVLNARKKAHFEALAEGAETDGLRSHHGFRVERYNQVFVVHGPRGGDSGNQQLSLHKSQSDLQQGLTTPNSLMFHHENEIVMLVSASSITALERNFSAVSNIATTQGLRVGASEIHDGSGVLLKSRNLATQAAEALSRRGRPGLLRHQDMGVELLLGGRARQDILEFTRQILAPLLQDGKHRALYDTLSHYIREGKSATRAAQALNIHPNTLYQRLQRVETLTGRRIDDASDFTLLSIACQLHAEYSGLLEAK